MRSLSRCWDPYWEGSPRARDWQGPPSDLFWEARGLVQKRPRARPTGLSRCGLRDVGAGREGLPPGTSVRSHWLSSAGLLQEGVCARPPNATPTGPHSRPGLAAVTHFTNEDIKAGHSSSLSERVAGGVWTRPSVSYPSRTKPGLDAAPESLKSHE